jgi:hypothetical protein
MTHLRYFLVLVTFLILVGSRLLDISHFSEWLLGFGSIFVLFGVILGVFISQKWAAFAACFLLLVGSIVGERSKYFLIVVALASWLAMHLLNYVSSIAGWFADLFKVCWLALFFLALMAPFFRRWRELAICFLTLFFTFDALFRTSLVPEPVVLPNLWLQEAGFRVYGSYLMRPLPSKAFLSRCELVDYIEEDGTRQQVGECDKGLRSTVWFRLLLIYDPSGQLAWPATRRTLAWRLAVLHLPEGRAFLHEDDARHLVGNFYWFLDSNPARGDDGKPRSD